MNKKIEHCKYADSCFECPLEDCKISQSIAYRLNKTDYDIFGRDHLKEVKRKESYKSVKSKY